MTINECITQISSIKPHAFTDDQLINWLSQLDGQLFEDVVRWHAFPIVKADDGTETMQYPDHGPYTTDDMEQELMASAPYDDIYIKWLSAQIDYYNGDITRYNNSMIMYNMALQAYENWINRTYLPLQPNFIDTRVVS